MDDEGNVCQDGGNPHKGKHVDTNVSFDVELVLGGQGDLGGNGDDGGNDGGDCDEDGADDANEGECQREPACADDEGTRKDEDKVEHGAGHEEAIHDLGADFQQVENGGDLGRQGNLGAGKKLADEDLDWVEPVKLFWFGAVCNAPKRP